ncbi:hypothetical protein L596_021915 [Steinernema carpocapsae]|uniref:Uncharacterized protein n=1 Tax=Steinernema carpocapsae TaxID=34508 RepID=A0A4U5MK73_STECR|nr:hypothetical protein L596_021915 [Steinernema carpocapsae]
MSTSLLRHSRSLLSALPPRPSSLPKTAEAPSDISQAVAHNGHLTQYSYMVEKMDIAQPTLEGTYRSNSVSPYKMVITLLYS